MTLTFSWNSWEFWVLAVLLLLNLLSGGCSHTEVLEKLDELESELVPKTPYRGPDDY